MKKVLITLEYRANDQYDNKFYNSLLKLNECVGQIDDLFITYTQITDVEDGDEE